jgi:RHS repeat-associated protein
LLLLEDRVVPATSFADFDAVGLVGKTVSVTVTHDQTQDFVPGRIDWKDGSFTEYSDWSYQTKNKTFTHTYSAAGAYVIETENLAGSVLDSETVTIRADVPPAMPVDVRTGTEFDLYAVPTGNNPSNISPAGVRYGDGVVRLNLTDLESTGYGMPWGLSRSWSNGAGYDAGGDLGNGWVQSSLPSIVQVDGTNVLALVLDGTNARTFDVNPSDATAYAERFFGGHRLTHDAGNSEYVLTTPAGVIYRFSDFSSTWNATPQRKGQFAKRTDPNGNVTEVTARNAAGNVTALTRGAGAESDVTETWTFTYVSGGVNDGKVALVSLARQPDGGSSAELRKVEYTYFGSSDTYGNAGDLKMVRVLTPGDAVISRQYFRYYKPEEADGFAGALKMAVLDASFERAAAALTDPTTATDAQLDDFADLHYKYDASRRVSEARVQGLGCSMCSGGVGTYTYTYANSSHGAPDGVNRWAVRTTETLPDGHQTIAYTNAYGQVMLSAAKDVNTSTQWRTAYVYDGQGRVTLTAHPSAVTGVNESFPELIVTNDARVGVGSEYRVNTYTTGNQTNGVIARDRDGDTVVAWVSAGQDGSGKGVYAQRYNSVGTPMGPEFRVNAYTTGDQSNPAVAMDAAGNFVVVWVSAGQDGSGDGVYARLYRSDGATVVSEFRVNTYTTGGQSAPEAAMDAAGNFVVVWASDGQDGSGFGVYAQRYDAAGAAQGGEFAVNTYATAAQSAPDVAMDESGDFAVVWTSYGQDGSYDGVYARRYNAAGVAQGGEFLVNTTTTNRQFDPAVAMDADGDFVVAWTGYVGVDDYDVYAQRFNAAGVAQGGQFRVNGTTTNIQQLQTLACSADGDFVIVWTSNLQDGQSTGIYGRYFVKDGTFGSLFAVNVFTTSAQTQQSIASDYDGNFVVAWESNLQDGSNYGVFARPLERAYTYLSDTSGLIERTEYARVTTAGSDTTTASVSPGDVAGLVSSTWVQKGDFGANPTTELIKQSARTYYLHSDGTNTASPLATATAYRDANAGGAQTTTYGYTFAASSLRATEVTITYPTVTTAQNGPNTADAEAMKLDRFGRVTWFKDGGGFLTYREYDDPTGAVKKQVVDVNTSTGTGDYSNYGSAPWSMPTGGGLRLITTTTVDFLGRPLTQTDPKGYVTYTVYNDVNHEVRVYPDWDASLYSGSGGPTGPTQIRRDDWANKYAETLTMSAAPSVSGGVPTGAESVAGLQSLNRTNLNNAGQAVSQDAYFSLTGLTYSTAANLGTLNTNYYRTRTDYADRGGVKRSETPTGTITRHVRDARNRVTETWIGTDDTPTTGYWSPTNTGGTDLTKVYTYAYDSGGVGDGNLTRQTAIPGGGAVDRKTDYTYDWRNRQVAIKDGVEASESTSVNRPIRFMVYDNLGHVVEQRTYDGDNVTVTVSGGLPVAPSDSLMRAKTVTDFDERRRTYQTRVVFVSPTSGHDTASLALATNTWFDSRGNVIKVSAPGGVTRKTTFDGAGRPTLVYSVFVGAETAYADADDVTGDTVYQQIATEYDANGNAIKVTTKHRFHDATATGELGDRTTNPKARITYTAAYYDRADRQTATVDVGTNGGDSWTRPSSAPSRSATVLVHSYGYDAAGRRSSATDPRAIEARTFYDALGRVTKSVEAYTGSGVPDEDYSDENKTVEFGYDGSNHRTSLKAWLDDPAGTEYDKFQETAWVYGVNVAGGSAFASNDLLAVEKQPDKTYGTPSKATGDQTSYKYNTLGERVEMTDRNGNVHAYGFDIVGRPTSDAVTTLGSGVDGSVRRLETAYDSAGLAYLFTSRAGSSETSTVVNQVQRTFNGLGQLTAEYQEHTGAVTTTTSPKVQYSYSEIASVANHSRLLTMTNPSVSGVNDRTLSYNYDDMSRITSIGDGSITLESLTYLGLGTVVTRAHPQPGVDLTYVTGSATTSLSKDQYTGFDRFGRIVDQKWTDGTNDLDRWQYGYDENGNRMYRDNTITAGFDELYHADGSSSGYDNVNQLREFQRGTFSGNFHTISSETRKQVWTPDLLGNFVTVATTQSTTTTETRGHNRQNQLNTIEIGSTTTTLAYDNAGNLTTDSASKALKYDAWNRQVNYDNYVGNRYGYDALNRRLKESTKTFYYSSNWQVLEERTAGSVQYRYAWSTVYVDAMIARDEYSSGSMNTRLYVLADVNFNVTALIGTAGAVLERYVYDPYGASTKLSDTWGSYSGTDRAFIYLHQGARLDVLVGMYHFRHRDASAVLMQWTEVDPIGFCAGDSNLYRYLAANPVKKLDPTGLAAAEIVKVTCKCVELIERGKVRSFKVETTCQKGTDYYSCCKSTCHPGIVDSVSSFQECAEWKQNYEIWGYNNVASCATAMDGYVNLALGGSGVAGIKYPRIGYAGAIIWVGLVLPWAPICAGSVCVRWQSV